MSTVVHAVRFKCRDQQRPYKERWFYRLYLDCGHQVAVPIQYDHKAQVEKQFPSAVVCPKCEEIKKL